MNITESLVLQRDRSLLTGDYKTYHVRTSRRIHTLRKRLGVATPRGRKFTPKAITAEDVAKNVESVNPKPTKPSC
jgi:signal recognition particle subunit SRP68